MLPIPGFDPALALSPLLRDVPFGSAEDWLAVLPEWMRDGDSPERDALASALVKAFVQFCSDCATYSGTTDPTYAVGDELDFLAIGRGMSRAEGETDASFRARLLNDDAIATPAAIMAAVKAIIAPFTSATPYYFETPDDEIFVYAHSDTDTDGFYLDCAVDPIEASWRQYDARKVSPPQHGLVWGLFRDADTRRTLGDKYLFEPVVGTDYTDAFNAWAHAVIAIPAFRLPGTLSTTDAFVDTEATLEAADLTGGLDYGAEVWTESDSEAHAAVNLDFGCEVYTLGGDGALVVESIDKLLATRAAFPVAFHILLDPTL